MSQGWNKGKRIAIAGARPGGVSAALELIAQGFDVRVYEKAAQPKPLGGAVLLSTPVLAIMRRHDIDVLSLGSKTLTHFANNKGKVRARLPFNENVEKALGIPGWHYGMLRSNAFGQLLQRLPEGVVRGGKACTGYEETADVSRVSAVEIEAAVINQLRAVFRQPEIVAGTWKAARARDSDLVEEHAREALMRLDPLWDDLFPAEQARIVTLLVERVDIGTDSLNLRLRMDGLAGLAREMHAEFGEAT